MEDAQVGGVSMGVGKTIAKTPCKTKFFGNNTNQRVKVSKSYSNDQSLVISPQ